MSTQIILVTGATGKTGQHTIHHLLEGGQVVRAMVHKEDERAEALRGTGVEVVVGELLEHDDVIRAAAGTSAAYFCYPVSPGLIQATAYFADAAKRAALKSRCKHVADFCAGRFREPRRARPLDRRTPFRLVWRSDRPYSSEKKSTTSMLWDVPSSPPRHFLSWRQGAATGSTVRPRATSRASSRSRMTAAHC